MSDELSLSGHKAISLLALPLFPADNRFGALFYDGNEAGKDEAVISFESDGFTTETRKCLRGWLLRENHEIIFTKITPELLSLIDSITPAFEKKQTEIDDLLRPIGFPTHATTVVLEEREFVWKLINQSKSPSQRDRSDFFEIAKRSGELHWCKRFFEGWLIKLESGQKPDPVGRMHLAYVLRHTRMLKQAIEVTNVVEFEGWRFPCPTHIMAMLCTQRAATFLDIFDHNQDPELLRFARLAINKAWSKAKSEEASAVYRRLDNCMRLIEEQNYKRRVDAAYVDWASWL